MAIARYNGHMSEVARRLGIGRSTLYRKLKEYGLEGNAAADADADAILQVGGADAGFEEVLAKAGLSPNSLYLTKKRPLFRSRGRFFYFFTCAMIPAACRHCP